MRVCLIQTESIGTKKENEIKIFNQLNDAIKEVPDIICLSELFLSLGKNFYDGIVNIQEIEKYQKFAKENNVNIILGSVSLESDIPNKTTNTSFIIDRNGKILGRYDKMHLFKVNKPNFKLDEFDDTILVFLPSHFNKTTGANAWEVLTRARAIENQVYFCAVNQTGEKLCGETKIISYTGEVLKSLDKEEGILTMDLNLEEQDIYRKEMPILEGFNDNYKGMI